MGMLQNIVKSFKIGSVPLMPSSSEGNEEIAKSERVREARAIVEDPLAIIQSLGYKDKPFSLSYETLKQMATRNSVIASIISTRVNQISSFSKPARYTKDGVGFEISMRDPKKQPNEEQKRLVLAIESFIENCGFSYDPTKDSFDTFIRKIVRDSLMYDQLTFEIVPDRLGRPAEFYAVDASTMRAAVVEPEEGEDYITSTTNNGVNDIKWVQVFQGQPIAEFTASEMCFSVRNPRTDMNIQPYGFSELEVLIHQVTSHLWAEEYNSRYFSQGGTTKGILNLKGQNISKEQLDAFRRQWTAQVSGMTGAWKTPVVSVDGLEYINVSQSNREMEYEMWMNYLINICCAVYQIDPAEINFPNRGGSGGSGGGGLGDGGIEDRLKNSKDKGLRPLLRFLEEVINRYIVRRFTDELSFNFVGLDPQTESDKLATTDKEIRTFRTINEVRKMKDLEPLEDGDIILDPTYTNYLLQKQQAEQMAQMGGEEGQGGEDVQGEDTEQGADWGQEGDQELSPEEQQQQDEDGIIGQSIDEQYNG